MRRITLPAFPRGRGFWFVFLLAALLLVSPSLAATAPSTTTLRAGRSPAPAEAPAQRWLIEAYGRYVTVPDFVADALFAASTSMHSYSVGAGARWRQPSGHEWRFSLDYLRLGYAPGNWLEGSLPPASAAYLEWDLGFLSVAASYTWRFDVSVDRLRLFVGLGLAFGVFLGDVSATDVLPVCEPPAARCPHWRWATRRTLELPTPVLALPIVHGGVDLRLVGQLWLRLEAGLYGIPFAGAALALGL